MERIVNVKFSSATQNADAWDIILAELSQKPNIRNGQQFAYFGGEKVAEIIALLEACEKNNNTTVVLERYTREGNEFTVCLHGNRDIYACLPTIKNILLLCDAQDMDIEEPESEY